MSVNKEYVITIVSQGTIGEKLFVFAKKLANTLKRYTIYYKLHPGEFIYWKNKIKDIEIPFNLKIVFDEENILSLFSKSVYVVGVYSTSVYEALYFECRILILNLPGYKYLEYLIKNNYANLIENVEQAQKIIEEDKGEIKKQQNDTIFGGV